MSDLPPPPTRAPDDYGPKGPFVVDSVKDPHGNCGLAPGYAWASWYDEDEVGYNFSLHWRPPRSNDDQPPVELVYWTKAGGVQERFRLDHAEMFWKRVQ